jgi:hypothetical protein
MKNTEWPRDKIRDVAGSSGKPLEVVCAEAFLGAGWKPRLGSHFADGALGTIRELDVLVEKEENLPGRSLTVRVRALLSCRDFPPERSPLTYSVSTARVPSFEPRLLSSHRATERLLVSGRSFGPLLEAEAGGAARLLRATNLDAARPLVAFDMFERTEQASKKGKNKKATVGFQRCRDGDRRLFSAIDSAVKAAFFWVQEDLNCSGLSTLLRSTSPFAFLRCLSGTFASMAERSVSPRSSTVAFSRTSIPIRPARKK